MAKKPRKPGKRITAKAVQDTENKPVTLPVVPVKPEVDDDPWGEDQLTLKQRLFAEAYVGAAGGNATKAAQLAGYRDDNNVALRVTACRTLTNANVQRAIARLVATKLGSTDWTRAGIAEIANANIADFMETGEDGEPFVNLKKASDAAALGLVREIKEEVIKGGGTTAVIKRSFKLHDRLRALEILAKMNGQLNEKLDITSGKKSIKFSLNIGTAGDDERDD